MHVHLNLGRTSGENLFSGPDGLSEVGRQFLAGLLAHARALSGVTNPSVNSYKRLVPGWEAPVYVSWARLNRSALLRIPASRPDAVRIEYRAPDASCNPYLAFAAILAAGLDGIQKGMEPPPPVERNIYAMTPVEKAAAGIASLPGNLAEALDELRGDPVVCEALGPYILDRFVAAKQKEWEEYSTRVHPWELETYLDV
jgi:glutamine synthetase